METWTQSSINQGIIGVTTDAKYLAWQIQQPVEDVVFYTSNSSNEDFYLSYQFELSKLENNPAFSVVELNSGEWQYIIHKMPDANDINLSKSLGVIEKGIVNIVDL